MLHCSVATTGDGLMDNSARWNRRGSLFVATALWALSSMGIAHAEGAAAADAATATAAAEGSTVEEVIVTAARTSRSSVELAGAETQKILPGVSPLKAIQT